MGEMHNCVLCKVNSGMTVIVQHGRPCYHSYYAVYRTCPLHEQQSGKMWMRKAIKHMADYNYMHCANSADNCNLPCVWWLLDNSRIAKSRTSEFEDNSHAGQLANAAAISSCNFNYCSVDIIRTEGCYSMCFTVFYIYYVQVVRA